MEGGLGNAMHIPILHPDVITTKPDYLVILPSFLTWWCLDEILLNQSSYALCARGGTHDFQTLEDNTEVLYHMSTFYGQHTRVACGGMTQPSASVGRCQ